MSSTQTSPGDTTTVFGGLIKHLRKDRKMTLQELGRETGLSASFLSLIERNKAIPSILSLVNIARAFDVDIDFFIRTHAQSSILHKADEPEILEIDSPIKFIRLSASLPQQKMDAYIYEIPPGVNLPKETAAGEFFYYLLSGVLKITAGDQTYTINPGDSLHFDANNGYRVENPGTDIARVLWTGSPPLLTNSIP